MSVNHLFERKDYPCSGHKAVETPLVFLHGWNFTGSVFQSLIIKMQNCFDVVTLDMTAQAYSCDEQQLLTNMNQVVPENACLVGWSLGGMLSLLFASQFPDRVSAVVTVASNPKWLADDVWPGMQPANLKQFCKELEDNPGAVRKQFCSLMVKGEADERVQVRALRQHMAAMPTKNLTQGLKLLAQLDCRQALQTIKPPVMHVFGERDLLVPQAVASKLNVLCPTHQVVTFPEVAHAPFVSAEEKFAELLDGFVKQTPFVISKQQVARSFSKAARDYDDYADLQKEVGNKLLKKLPSTSAKSVVDLGTGTGYFLPSLRKRYGQAAIHAVDIAPGMLRLAAQRLPEVETVCADAEVLPFEPGVIDVVFSNLMMQWCANINNLFAGLYRVLSEGGQCVISTFGSGTLGELESAWKAVDQEVHVNRFESLLVLEQAAIHAGFSVVESNIDEINKGYDNVRDLLRELKCIGAHNMNAGKGRGLTGKHRFQKFERAYEKLRVEDRLPARWNVITLVLKKGVEKGVEKGE